MTSTPQANSSDCVSAEDVLKRRRLLVRIGRDIVDCFETRRKAKERHEELVVISRKFNSSEIQETINNLRRLVSERDRDMEELEKEVQLLGGFINDSQRGLIYFYSERDSRRVFLVWDPEHPSSVSWHELDESFADRLVLDIEAPEDEAPEDDDGDAREDRLDESSEEGGVIAESSQDEGDSPRGESAGDASAGDASAGDESADQGSFFENDSSRRT